MVSAGQWRDYAIDGLSDAAVFSVYERASQAPLYRIEKRPALARRQGAWAVIGQAGMILRRGHELDQVLRFFDRDALPSSSSAAIAARARPSDSIIGVELLS